MLHTYSINKLYHKHISYIDEFAINDDNECNTTATLSALRGVAQPWRFFCAR